MQTFTFQFPTQLHIGVGIRRDLGQIAASYGKKAFIALDPFLKGSQTEKELLEDLSLCGISAVVFSDIVPNPRNTSIDKGTEQCRKERCELVIAIGGGSAIDSSKAIALTAKWGGKCWDYTERQGGECTPSARSRTASDCHSDNSRNRDRSNPVCGD
jgi:alcohol dehydrogenase class IV